MYYKVKYLFYKFFAIEHWLYLQLSFENNCVLMMQGITFIGTWGPMTAWLWLHSHTPSYVLHFHRPIMKWMFHWLILLAVQCICDFWNGNPHFNPAENIHMCFFILLTRILTITGLQFHNTLHIVAVINILYSYSDL